MQTVRRGIAPFFVVGLALVLLAGTNAMAQVDCGCMDLVFVVDDTGSMGGAINNVRAELPSIVSSAVAASGGDLRVALVTFKDNVNVRVDLTTDIAAVNTAIGGLFASGGSGEPEASDEALNTVINTLPAAGRNQIGDFGALRSECLKIAVLVTDARPAGFDDFYTPGVDDVNADARAEEAATKGILISAVYVPTFGVSSTIVTIMQNYADKSGGVYRQVASNGVGTGSAIEELVSTCGRELFASVTPCGITSCIRAGSAFSYPVSAEQRDGSGELAGLLTVDATGVPAGATHTPPLPITDNPVSSTFEWTPGAGDLGSHTIRYSATDETGRARNCTVILDVATDCGLFVVLSSYGLEVDDHVVTANWETSLELDNMGFYLWRRDKLSGNEERVSGFIPAIAPNGEGASYTFSDLTPINGVEYDYFIQDLDIYGKSTIHEGAIGIANPRNPRIKLRRPEYGTIVQPDKANEALTLSFEAPRGRHTYALISPDPEFLNPEMTLAIRLRNTEETTLDSAQMQQLETLASVSGGVLYWRVVELSRTSEVLETSPTWRFHFFGD